MSARILLQIGIIGCGFGIANAGFSQPLVCQSTAQLIRGNYTLQTPVGFFTGEIPDGSHILRIYLTPGQEREVFALHGVFEFEEEEKWTSPVFICEQKFPVWYQLPHYSVACPRMPHEPVMVWAHSRDLFDVGSVELTYWTPQCVARRRVNYDCLQPKMYPDLPRRSGVGADGTRVLTMEYRNYPPPPDPRQIKVPWQCVVRNAALVPVVDRNLENQDSKK
jgi:hypothetical protein